MMLDAALRYAARGWPVLPLAWPIVTGDHPVCSCSEGPACRHIGKHPRARRGVHAASTDEGTIRAWWRAAPHANIALALGPDPIGIWALDVDPKSHGDRTLADLVREHGPIGPTLHAITGSGGDHYFFRWPASGVAGAAHRLGRGLDAQAAGQYVVAAPSLHASGARYEWEDERAELLDAPAWVLALVTARAWHYDPPARPFDRPRVLGADRVLQRAAAYLDAMPPAIAGQGGDRQTTRAAHAMVKGFGLSPTVALELLLTRFNPRCEPPWKPADIERKIAYVARTSASATAFLLRAS